MSYLAYRSAENNWQHQKNEIISSAKMSMAMAGEAAKNIGEA
jgi:hypothetical protein